MHTLLNEKQAAEQLAVSLATLRRRRCEGRPPHFVKIGASVRYRSEDVDAFIESCRVQKQGGRMKLTLGRRPSYERSE